MDNSYFDSEDFREMLDSYEQQLANGESPYLDADDFADIADYYLSHDCPAKADEAVERGLELHEGDEVLLTVRVATLIYRHRFEEARKCMRKHGLDSNDNLYQEAQLVYALDGDADKAEEMFRKWMAIELEATEKAYRAEVERDSYMHIISSFIELRDHALDNPDDFKLIWRWIDEYIDRFQPLGRFETDVTVMDICRHNKLAELLVKGLTQVLDEQPYLEGGWATLALGHFTLEQFDQAIEASDFALAIDPHDKEALLTRAYSHHLQGQKAEASKFFAMYLDEPDADMVQAITYADCLAAMSGPKDKVMSWLDMGMEAFLADYETIDPNDADTLEKYAQTMRDASNLYQMYGQHEQAEQCIRRMLQLEPYVADHHFALGNALLAQQNDQNAVDAFAQAISLADDQILMAIDVAYAMIMNNYVDYASGVIDSVERTVEEIKYDKSCLRGIPVIRALIYLKRDDSLRFLWHFKKAVECAPDMVKTVFGDYFPDELPVDEYYDYALKVMQKE